MDTNKDAIRERAAKLRSPARHTNRTNRGGQQQQGGGVMADPKATAADIIKGGTADATGLTAKLTRRKRNSVLIEEARGAARRILQQQKESGSDLSSPLSQQELASSVEQETWRALQEYVKWCPYSPGEAEGGEKASWPQEPNGLDN